MNYGGDKDCDTICAVSTPSGFGGISVVRMSGPRAFDLGRQIAGFLPAEPESHRVYFGTLTEIGSKNPIDEVLVSSFHHGKSFTGEQTLEISCHGSPTICHWILQQLILAGARIAERGEFTYRAFMNGRIDLIQAEGVMELVESQSQRSVQQGLRQLKGGLSEHLQKTKKELLFILANIEAAIDFSTEDIDVLKKQDLITRGDRARVHLKKMVESYSRGRWVAAGLRVALTGLPNVGKSSLFNCVLEEDRSIVTAMPGTTRDVVESAFLLEGLQVRLLDTAGIRESNDSVERLGIQRSHESHRQADIALLIFDSSQGLLAEEMRLLSSIGQEKIFLIGNKSDLLDPKADPAMALRQRLETGKFFTSERELDLFMSRRVLFVSTQGHKDNGSKTREQLQNLLKSYLREENFEDDSVISQARHFELAQKALLMVEKGLEALRKDHDVEFVSLDFKQALLALQEMLGERYDDQVMDFVFQQFCLGK